MLYESVSEVFILLADYPKNEYFINVKILLIVTFQHIVEFIILNFPHLMGGGKFNLRHFYHSGTIDAGVCIELASI